MKIIDIPPYQRAGVNYDPAEGHFMMRDLMARAMVNMKLRQSPRAYPTDALKAKPAFR